MYKYSFNFTKRMELIIFLGLIILTKSQMIYPDQYEYAKNVNYPVYDKNQQRLYQASYNPVAYAAPAAPAATGTYSQDLYYAQQQQPAQATYYASQQQPVQPTYYAPQQAAYAPQQTGYAVQAAYAPQQTEYAVQAAYAPPLLYSSAFNVNQPQKRASINSGTPSETNNNRVALPISPLAQSLPPDWAYQVNNIISKGVTKLALDIQNVIYANNLASVVNENENIVFSPLNLAGALAMIHLGSAGITFEETSRILGLATGVDISTHSELVHQIFGLLMSVIHQSVSGSARTTNIANGIFVQNGFPIRSEFKTISENVYKSEVENLDFQLKGNEAKDKINAWVKEKTNGKIASILNDVPSPSTLVVIASALYFNAEWDRHFIQGATGKRPFSIEPNQEITVDFMYNAGDFPFYEDPNIGVKIVGLPYKGLDMTMYIMLPTIEGARALGGFEKTLTPEIIEYLIQNTKNQTTILGIPKMKITSSLKLKRVLQSLGLLSLFDPTTADLSLLSPGPDGQNNLNPNLNVAAITDPNNRPGFNIRRLAKKKREIEKERINDTNDVVNRVKRQNRIPEEFLRIIENRNYQYYGLDNLRNSATLSNPHLYADEVLHKVDIDINERGTEAAAATAVVLERDGSQKRLIANRPFLFFIRHNPTKLILFWGTINRPTPNYSTL
ncbi:PREDICTED: serpin B3-like isoform X3 [Polistes canadensis]|uniref:serpin B3-like isoform X3 n=1 Tax=Polistes canadensis TaxID=91411 RepID=UPI000718FE88|nr:PREDICTED: serpin B3-like isoform X3 [Polistes canadensis]